MKLFIPYFLLMFGCFQASAQNDSLINVLEKTLEEKIDDLGAEHPDVAVYCDSLGKMYMNARNSTKAVSLLNQALNIKLKQNEVDSLDIADSYTTLGVCYGQQSDYVKADTFFTNALNVRLEILGEEHPDIVRSYNDLGVLYYHTSDHEEAFSLHNKALDIGRKILGEEHLEVARSYINLGILYNYTGDYEKAFGFYNKALDIRKKIYGEAHSEVAKCYTSLGNLYSITGDYEKAIDFYNKVLNISLEKFGEKYYGVALSYNNLGIAYSQIGDYEKAIGFYNKALNIWLEIFGEKHYDVARSYNDLGTVYYQTGDYEKAIRFQNKALNIWLEMVGKKHRGVARSYNDLGTVYYQRNDYEKAIRFYDKALNIWLEIFNEQHTSVMISYSNLAVAYEKNTQHKTADSLWHIAIPQIAKQLKSTYLFLENDQRIKYSSTFASEIDDFYSFTAIHNAESTTQLATNILLNTKSLALEYAVSTQQLVKKINDSTLNIQYEQLNNLGKQIANVEQLTNQERQTKDLNLSEIRDKREKLAFQMFQHPQLKSKLNIKDIEWQDIQHHLASDEVTIDFLKIHEQKDSLWTYYAILIHKNYPSPQLVRIADEKTLAKLLKTGKNERPYYLNDRRAAKTLYKILWQPIGQYLQDIKTVHISPSGILHRVPFESLYDENNEYLSTKYDFHYHTAIRDLLKEKTQQTTYKDMVLMGHILYDLDEKDQYESEEEALAFRGNTRDSIRPLPETLREVVQIKRTAKRAKLKTTILTIDAASEDAVQYFVKDNAPSIFHFATHGVFLPPLEKTSLGTPGSRDRLRAADNPLQRSALMLYGANETWTKGSSILSSGEDGILTALEVSTLDLQNTGLVVLSACSTGLGNVHNTEGVFGLQRAFKLAGVNHVIASLWDVDDEATKELMVAFYKNLLQKKQTPANALRNAKNQLRKAGYQPQDWAGFILIE